MPARADIYPKPRQVVTPLLITPGEATRYFLPGWVILGRTTNAITANRLHYIPFFVGKTRTVDGIACEVTVGGAAGTLIRLGIYYGQFNTDGELEPSSLLRDAGTVTADSAAVKSIAFATPLTLGEGFHFAALSSDGAPTLRVPGTTSGLNVPTTGVSAAPNTQHHLQLLAVIADGKAALPDPGTAPTNSNVNESFVWLYDA